MHIQIEPFEVIQLIDQLKHLRAQGIADLKRRGASILIELPDLVGTSIGIVLYFDFNEFRRAGLEYPPVSKSAGAHGKRKASGRRKKAS